MTPDQIVKVKKDYPGYIAAASRRITGTFESQLGVSFSAEQLVRLLDLLGQAEDIINE